MHRTVAVSQQVSETTCRLSLSIPSARAETPSWNPVALALPPRTHSHRSEVPALHHFCDVKSPDSGGGVRGADSVAGVGFQAPRGADNLRVGTSLAACSPGSTPTGPPHALLVAPCPPRVLLESSLSHEAASHSLRSSCLVVHSVRCGCGPRFPESR